MARIDDIGDARRKAAETGRRQPALALVGISHHTADFEVLERATFDESSLRRAVRLIRSADAVLETTIVSTCNRTEIYMVSRDHEAAVGLARELLYEASMPDDAGVFVKFGRDVVTHLFRVAAGIDSLMVGEAQVLGQVKQALGLAEQEESSGTILGKLFGRAFRTGKRVRTETEIGEGAVSVSYAALGLAQKIYSDLRDRTLIVVGAGETGALAARHFAEAGVGRLLVINRTPERAARLAQEIGGQAIPWDDLASTLHETDIVVSATSAPQPIIDRDMVHEALRKRGSRRLALIDIAMPRDIDPAVNELDGVFLYDMAALGGVVQRNLERRRREIPRVESIVSEEVEGFDAWQGSLQAGPTIQDLREHFEGVRRAEIDELRKHLSDEDAKRVERATRSMLNKLLHRPQVVMRRPQPGATGTESLVAAVRDLFGLDGDTNVEREKGGTRRGQPDGDEGGEES